MNLWELCGQSGPIAVLCNGPSLPADRLDEITIPTFGMNRTHFFPSDYYLALEPEWLDVEFKGKHLLNAAISLDPTWPAHGIHVKLQPYKKFSMDTEAGFYPAGTGYLAGQVAAALGYDTIHFLGLDLTGDHFDGDPGINMADQHEYFDIMAARLKRAGMKAFICAAPASTCRSFPHSGMGDICQ